MNTIKTFSLLTFLIFSQSSLAAFFVVNTTDDETDTLTGNGICATAQNTCSLRAAIMEANDLMGADTILVQAGLGDFTLSRVGEEDIGLHGDLDIKSEITIINGTSGITINGHFTDRIFHVHGNGNLTLENITLLNGVANSDSSFEGGAIKIEEGGYLTATEVTFSNNLAKRGGAVFSDGTAWFIDSYFHHNAVSNDVDSNNLSSVGSAILNRGALLFATSTAAHNGQLFSNPSNANLSGSQFSMHFNQNGGAMPPPVSLIFNSTVADNGHGGIRSDGGFTNINQSTIANHDVQGMRFSRIEDDHDDELQLEIKGSLFANNGFQDCNDIWVIPDLETNIVNNYNASTDDTCGFTGMDDIENIDDPFNGSLHNWGGYAPTLMLNHDSFAVDHAGQNCTDLDQRGKDRPLDGNNNEVFTCDMGALELDPMTDPMDSDVIFKNNFAALL